MKKKTEVWVVECSYKGGEWLPCRNIAEPDEGSARLELNAWIDSTLSEYKWRVARYVRELK